MTNKITKKLLMLFTTITLTLLTGLTAFAADRVSVHDPSVVKDGDTYYIFGSHRAFAKSTDLTNWQTFRISGISSGYDSTFAAGHEWTKYDSSGNATTDVKGNLWAPDVIYNEQMQKWCMYMSLNGTDHNSLICLLTADSIEGPYTYVGEVVYSGFTNNSDISKHGWTHTDVPEVLNTTSLPSRYTTTDWAKINAIDPNVFYTEEGNLVMVYGSWSAGIYMLELDESTGLRDYSVNYGTAVKNGVDPYFGYKIAGGYYVSGEGAYIHYDKDTGYYYLYISYGNLEAAGGYNIRVFRAKKYSGPYVDTKGRSAVYAGWTQQSSPRGLKLFGNYFLSGTVGYKAGGHNSILYDDDGKKYVVYHTRFNNGSEGHEVRVHQFYMNNDGWPVVAPYEYSGETISSTGYDYENIVGRYQFVDHGVAAPINTSGTTPVGMLSTYNIYLNADGSVTGQRTGTWSVEEGTPDITITMSGKTYTGKVLYQKKETTDAYAYCFTVASDKNNCVWATKSEITNRVTSVSLSQSTAKLNLGGSIILTSTKTPSTSSEQLNYTSSNKNVATVTSSGQVIAKGVGTAVIYVRSTYGKEAKCTVIVRANTPTSLKVKKSGTAYAKLTWTAGKGAVSYDIYRSTKKSGTYTKIATTTKTTYTDKTIKAGKNYYYKVLSRGSKTVNTYNSNRTSAVRMNIPVKVKKKSLKAINDGFKLTVKKQSVSGYQVVYSLKKNFKSSTKTTIKKNTLTVNKLKDKKTYYIKVRAYNTINGVKVYGAYSNVLKIKTK